MRRRLVVGVAIGRGGLWLVARRTRPAHLAGCLEFPGGKVEPGESVGEAAVREIREELGVDIAVTGEVPGRWPIDDHLELVVVTATTMGEPVPGDTHDALAWVRPGELASIDWVPADRAPAAELVRATAGGAPDA